MKPSNLIRVDGMVQQHMHRALGYSDGRVFDKMKRTHMNKGVKTNQSHFYK
jgi:hypothetical protein